MDSVEIWPWLGLDSLLACAALSFTRLSWRERSGLALAFGVCDAVATGLAPILTPALPLLPLVGIYLLAVLSLGYCARASRLYLAVLPLGLSIDNLLDRAPPAMAAWCGLSSALLAFLGLQAPALLRAFPRATPPRGIGRVSELA